MSQTSDISPTYSDIQSKVSALKAALDSANPGFSSLLRTIHSQIKNDPACTTLLSPEEIAMVVSGLEKQTNTYLAQTVTKSSGKAGANKALAKTKMEDLGF